VLQCCSAGVLKRVREKKASHQNSQHRVISRARLPPAPIGVPRHGCVPAGADYTKGCVSCNLARQAEIGGAALREASQSAKGERQRARLVVLM
jgi:hypothetical protein